jgi:ArsR family transcriptional regulator, virulence genes transcriptional regulator
MNKRVSPEFVSRFAGDAGKAAALLKAMANDSRLLVLCHLSDAGELSVTDLVTRVGLGQSAMSQHLARLRDEGLVSTRKEAQTVFYRVSDPKAEQLLGLLHDLFCPDLQSGEFQSPKGS